MRDIQTMIDLWGKYVMNSLHLQILWHIHNEKLFHHTHHDLNMEDHQDKLLLVPKLYAHNPLDLLLRHSHHYQRMNHHLYQNIDKFLYFDHTVLYLNLCKGRDELKFMYIKMDKKQQRKTYTLRFPCSL